MLRDTEDVASSQDSTEMKKESEFGQLETEVQRLKKSCIEIEDLSQDLNNLLMSGDTTRPEVDISKERERGNDRIAEVHLKVSDGINILDESKRLLKLLKEKFE